MKSIEKKDFSEKGLDEDEYFDTQFVECNLQGVNLSDVLFESCEFVQCDLSNSDVSNTAFQDIRFVDCRLLGVPFRDVKTFLLKMQFEGCDLSYVSFGHLDLEKSGFERCILKEVDFFQTNLSGATMRDCELTGAIFDETDLRGADLTGSTNFRINPQTNRVENATFSRDQVYGLIEHLRVKLA